MGRSEWVAPNAFRRPSQWRAAPWDNGRLTLTLMKLDVYSFLSIKNSIHPYLETIYLVVRRMYGVLQLETLFLGFGHK
jgi:hypothetical protein